MTAGHRDDSPIEDYLDLIVTRFPAGRPRCLRHLLAETEAHLRDAAEAMVAQGTAARDAEAMAVSGFGSAQDLVDAESDRPPTSLRAVARQAFVTGLLLAGVAGLAVAASGLLAGVLRWVAGSRWLVDVPPGHSLPASDCARWLALDPSARTCHAAALSDWAGETVFYRLAVGVVASACLLAFWWLRRRPEGRSTWSLLPGTVTNTLAATLFAAAAVGTLGLGLNAVVTASGHGAGQWLSATPVALAAAAAFGLRLMRDLRHHDV